MRSMRPWLGIPLFLVALPVCAQIPADAAVRVRDDQRSMVRYGWQMRTEIVRAGESLGSMVEQLRFSNEGTVLRTMISDERRKPALHQKTRARIERIIMTAVPYVVPDPEKLQSFLDAAEVIEERTEFRIRGQGFLEPDDLVEFGIAKEGMRIAWMTAVAPLDHDSLKVRATYEVLPDDTNVVVQLTADHRAGDMRLTMDNSEFARLR